MARNTLTRKLNDNLGSVKLTGARSNSSNCKESGHKIPNTS